jgi:hypothetical protein
MIYEKEFRSASGVWFQVQSVVVLSVEQGFSGLEGHVVDDGLQ